MHRHSILVGDHRTLSLHAVGTQLIAVPVKLHHGLVDLVRTMLQVEIEYVASVEDFLDEERLTEQCIGGWSATVTSTPETALLAKLDVRRLEAAIAALPLAFREVLILRDVQGLEYREIAEVTTLPVGTVMSRLARARRRIIGAVRTNDA